MGENGKVEKRSMDGKLLRKKEVKGDYGKMADQGSQTSPWGWRVRNLIKY